MRAFKPRTPLRAIAAGAAALSTVYVYAQEAASSVGAASTVVISASPLRNGDVAAPSTVLTGEALVERRGSTLGETLDNLPGVSASYFGPNASRPIIRGQDGDRIRVLSNSGATLDASSLSFDHAVPIDPLVVERIEVLRGPAALLYGGSAVGGVVNAIDNRIPRDKIDSTSGAIEALLGGGATERGLSALVETGGAGFALHADAFKRRTDDLRVPAFDRPLDDGTTARRTRIVNSDSNADGGALGGSMVWDHGYLGASLDTYRNAYGTVAEEDVKIHMRRNKLALAGEVRDLGGVISTVRGQLGATDYEHQEVQGDGTVGTTFKNKGTDLRLETVHRPMSMGDGKLDGAFGLQGEQSRFNALGEEAFVPTTHTRQLAGFVYEQWTHGTQGHLSAGLRAERVHVDSDGDTEFSDGRFGPPQRSGFTPRSGSIGGLLNLSKEWQLTTHWAYTERAPVSYELYANGVHAATGTFERGDRAQRKERGQNVDISLQWKRDTDSIKLGAFTSRFSNYIALMRSGDPDFVDASGASFPVYEFRGVKARLQGFEIEGHWRVFSGRRHVDLDGHVDLVRGDNRSSGEPLPRIAPVRTTLGVNWESGPWTSRAEVVHAAKQSRVPSDDMPTPGWTLVNLSTAYNFNWSQNDVLLFVKLGNVGNRLAYNAASIATVRALAPLPGRSLMAGVRVSF